VIAIYARENGQGMAFPAPSASTGEADDAVTKTVVSAIKPVVGLTTASSHQTQDNDDPSDPPKPPQPSAGSRPQLKRIK
jgi:stringent starvation protein B